jgi:hypothetical protein
MASSRKIKPLERARRNDEATNGASVGERIAQAVIRTGRENDGGTLPLLILLAARQENTAPQVGGPSDPTRPSMGIHEN